MLPSLSRLSLNSSSVAPIGAPTTKADDECPPSKKQKVFVKFTTEEKDWLRSDRGLGPNWWREDPTDPNSPTASQEQKRLLKARAMVALQEEKNLSKTKIQEAKQAQQQATEAEAQQQKTAAYDEHMQTYAPDGTAASVKLDWSSEVRAEVLKRLGLHHTFQLSKLEFPAKIGGNDLSKDDYERFVVTVKKELREAKYTQIQADATAKGEEAYKKTMATLQIEQEAQGVDDDGSPMSGELKKRYRALLRFHFNRMGIDKNGKSKRMTWWDIEECETEESGRTKAKDLKNRRILWARNIVKETSTGSFDPSNPPLPPLDLYRTEGYAEQDLPRTKDDALFDSVPEICDHGGEALWLYLRNLEERVQKNPKSFVDKWKKWKEKQSVGSLSGADYFDEEKRNTQYDVLKDAFTEYLIALNELKGEDNAAYNYTQGSGPFNKYLLHPGPVDHIPSYGSGAGGAAGNNFSGVIGPPVAVHRLYKLIDNAPRMPSTMHLLRGVKTSAELPHLRGSDPISKPTIGQPFVNTTFISTSIAAPEKYFNSVLKHFINASEQCCWMVFTTPANFPALPIVFGQSAYPDEQEVILPPGVILHYVKEETDRDVEGSKMHVVYYDVLLPDHA